MADNNTTTGWRPEMHADEHIGTYSGFISGAKFAIGSLVVVLVLMAIFFL